LESLLIYKASAGSGKTFTLVQEYLRLILKSGDVYRFKRIMAMTFTNKAAFEMKERVIKALNQLTRQETESDLNYAKGIADNFHMSLEELQEKSQNALSAILHNYSDLNIQTIDKFNVRLIRSFIRDLNMSNDFEVLVDTTEFNEKVVDKFLDSISSKDIADDKNQMVIKYLEAKLEEEDKWGIREDLIDTLKYFEKETFRIELPLLLDYDFNMENLKQLRLQLERVEQQFEKEKAALFNKFLQSYSSDEFKKNILGIKNQHHLFARLVKLKNQDISSFEGFSDSNQVTIETFFEENPTGLFAEDLAQIGAFVARTSDEYQDEFFTYKLAIASYFRLSLLKYLVSQLNIQKLAENKIPINEINELISTQMRQEHADYIYERIGVRFDHFLLDEFQDTSRMQWLNLIPLVHNAMAQGQTNLIVGDSKQAIYRFRNGMVEQFAQLPKIFNPEEDIELARTSEYFDENSLTKTLGDNWRSRKDIIEFNNHLFANIREILREDFQSYYHDKDLIQSVKNQERGYIYAEVELFTKENGKSATTDNQDDHLDQLSQEEILKDENFMLQRIKDVLSRGYQLRDICVLGRNNKDLARWAKFLIKNGLDVTTDEGLVVSNSMKVKFLVSWMQLISKPGSAQNQRDFALNYFVVNKEVLQEDFLPFFNPKYFDYSAFLDAYFSGEQIHQMRYENLYDLVLKILHRQGIDELSDPFLHFFCNLVQSFDISQGPNLDKFLHYYNTRGRDKRVPLADGNAIRLMTAHKSKGLEFPVVIMPQTKWDWSVRKAVHLFHDKQRQLFYLAPMSKNNATQLQQTLHQEELAKNKLDAFNLFYVACTRAVDELHMRAAFDMPKEAVPEHLAYAISKYFQEHHTAMDHQSDTFTSYGLGIKTTKTSSNYLAPNMAIHLFGETLWFPEISLIDSDSIEDLSLSESRVLGRVVHAVLEHMQIVGDLNRSLEQEAKSLALPQELTASVRKHLEQLLDNPEIVHLIFPQNDEHTLDEREIIVSASERIRPDRVIIGPSEVRVIDYKTGLPRKRDIKQIQEYAYALMAMGYENCKAYLVYTDEMKVNQVI
jgi:ATP-dependent exoDNAse (exonuclease V) beta subunit